MKIADTPKGCRIFLEGLHWPGGTPYTVKYTEDAIVIHRHPEGRRKVVASKGGVIDLQSKKVTQWAQGATVANVGYGADMIIITRG